MSRQRATLVSLSVFILGFLILWKVTGGLWERKSDTIDFRRIYQTQIQRARAAQDEGQMGAAQCIQNQLYGGTHVPGFSTAPAVEPNEKERQERARREAEKPLRLALQRRAMEDLAEKLGGLSIRDVSLISWSERTWLDSALGCARPGESIVGATIPGWMFVLSFAGDKRSLFVYNASRNGQILRFCRRQRKSTEDI